MKRACVIDLDGGGSAPWHGRPSDSPAVAELLSRNSDGSPNFQCTVESASEREFDRVRLGSTIFEALYEARSLAVLYLKSQDPLRAVKLPFDELLSLVGKSMAADKVLILDVAGPGQGWSDRAMRSLALPEGMSLLTAGRPMQAGAASRGAHAFSVLLVRALQGGAADLRGFVTPRGIFSVISESLGASEDRPLYRSGVSRFVPIRTTAAPQVDQHLARLPVLFPSPQAGLRLDPSYEPSNTRERGAAFRDPEAKPAHTSVMRDLHRLVTLGLVVPIGHEHLAMAALNATSCRLTALGLHYWRLAKKAAEERETTRSGESA